MSLVGYVLIFTLVILITGIYFTVFGINSNFIKSAVLQNILKIHLLRFKFFIPLFSSVKQSIDKEYLIEKKLDIEDDIKKQSNQLKKNLRTLNYITLLQADVHIIKDPKRLEEINKLKEGVELQILKNTKILNKYKQLDISSI